MKRNKAAAGKTPAAAYLFGRVGRMMEDGRYLDEFIRNHRKDKTVLDKLTGKAKRQVQTAEGKLTETLEAAEKKAQKLGLTRSPWRLRRRISKNPQRVSITFLAAF